MNYVITSDALTAFRNAIEEFNNALSECGDFAKPTRTKAGDRIFYNLSEIPEDVVAVQVMTDRTQGNGPGRVAVRTMKNPGQWRFTHSVTEAHEAAMDPKFGFGYEHAQGIDQSFFPLREVITADTFSLGEAQRKLEQAGWPIITKSDVRLTLQAMGVASEIRGCWGVMHGNALVRLEKPEGSRRYKLRVTVAGLHAIAEHMQLTGKGN